MTGKTWMTEMTDDRKTGMAGITEWQEWPDDWYLTDICNIQYKLFRELWWRQPVPDHRACGQLGGQLAL
jgi:hypothetical protein